MASDQISTSHASPIQPRQITPAETATFNIVQGESDESCLGMDDVAFNPLVIAQRKESLEAKRGRKPSETTKEEKSEEKVAEISRLERVAEKYQNGNPELQSRTLLALRARMLKDENTESILKKLTNIYGDLSLADEALDFLIDTSDAETVKALREAKENINDRFGREIRAGRNIGARSRAFSSQGLGSPTALRDMYRDITANPRETTTLFDELNSKFTHEKMGTVIDFLLHSLGSDLKSKGPSIARGELHRLVTETRALQGILGVYRFFQSRMRIIYGYFQRHGIIVPARMTYIALAKQFIKLLQDRYPNADKILQLAADWGLLDIADAQVILCSQYRDGLRQVSPRLFRSEKHKNDLSMMLAMALDKMHKKIEEEEEEKEKKQQKKEEKKEEEK